MYNEIIFLLPYDRKNCIKICIKRKKIFPKNLHQDFMLLEYN